MPVKQSAHQLSQLILRMTQMLSLRGE